MYCTCNTATGMAAGVGLGAGQAGMLLTLLLDAHALKHRQRGTAGPTAVSVNNSNMLIRGFIFTSKINPPPPIWKSYFNPFPDKI